ncbi:MAG: V-type ATP synthase subunit E [Pseudomonadota bacterium]
MATHDEVSQLERALLDQAEGLAREKLRNAEAERAHRLAELDARLAARAETALDALRAETERAVRRRVQAAEGRQAAELDRLRWALTEANLSGVRLALTDLVADPDRYFEILAGFLAEAAARLPAGDLVAAVNAADLVRLAPQWDVLVARAAPGRRIRLTGHGRDSLGGLCVRHADGQTRVDQTFEARQERLAELLAGTAMRHLFPGQAEWGGDHG